MSSNLPVASMIILSLGGQSRWTIEVSVLSAAALISMSFGSASFGICKRSTISSTNPEYNTDVIAPSDEDINTRTEMA